MKTINFMVNNAIKSLLFCLLIGHFSTNIFANNAEEELKLYLNNIKSVAIEFEQIDSNGNLAKGQLIIDKPHKFRCNYYSPFPLLIIGNVNYISVYDYEMENLSRISAKDNIFNFLLIDKIDFKSQFSILSSKIVKDNYIIKFSHNESGKISEIIFDHQTRNITQLKIYEDSNIINIVFTKINNIDNISKDLFNIKDPDIFGKPSRLNSEQLSKKYKIRN